MLVNNIKFMSVNMSKQIKFSIIALAALSVVLISSFAMMIKDHQRNVEKDFAIVEMHYKSQKEKAEQIRDRFRSMLRMKIAFERKEMACLARNVFYEASGESRNGKYAVAFVTMNRYKHKDFPNSVCDVVYERNVKTCQFSWVCGVDRKITKKSYEEAYKIAKEVFRNHGKMHDITNGALYFHADYVKPSWAAEIYKTSKFGKHHFYYQIVSKYNPLKKEVKKVKSQGKKQIIKQSKGVKNERKKG